MKGEDGLYGKGCRKERGKGGLGRGVREQVGSEAMKREEVMGKSRGKRKRKGTN